MWCTSQTLTHLATCLSSEALQLWYHVNNTLVICRTAPVTAVCPRTVRCRAIWGETAVVLTGEWKQNTRNPFCHSAGQTAERVALLSALTCQPTQNRAHKHTHARWNKQLARELTTLALILTESIWSESALSRTCYSHRVNSRRGLEISNDFSLIDFIIKPVLWGFGFKIQ